MILAYIIPYLIGFTTTTMLLYAVLQPIEGIDETIDYFDLKEDEL